MKATERLYLTAKRDRVVREGDLEAAFLWRTPGKDITPADAKKFGITGGALAVEDEPEAEPEEKAVEAAPENKAVEAAPETKAAPTRAPRS